MDAIRAVRARRAEMNVPPSKKTALYILSDKAEHFRQGTGFICRLAYAQETIVCDAEPAGHEDMVSVVTSDAKLYIPLDQLIDFEKELERLTKEMEKAKKEIASYEGKLANENFVSRAPEAVVNAERAKLEKAKALLRQLEEDAKRLKK
jgi:valyl-tRNA synthetase